MKVIAACHVHSDWSYDGRWPLERIGAEFRSRGYDAVFMTEHDRGFSAERLAAYRSTCARCSSPRLVLVPGIEYSDAQNRVHILTWGDVPFLGQDRDTQTLLAEVSACSGVAVFAHPARRNASADYRPEWSRCLTGVEIWNRKSDGWAPEEKGIQLAAKYNLVPFVGLDFHDERQLFPLAMQLELATPLTMDALVDELRHRRCRASAFGTTTDCAVQGWMGRTLRSAERVRKAASSIRRLVAPPVVRHKGGQD